MSEQYTRVSENKEMKTIHVIVGNIGITIWLEDEASPDRKEYSIWDNTTPEAWVTDTPIWKNIVGNYKKEEYGFLEFKQNSGSDLSNKSCAEEK